jgi:hypothetical protein
MKKKPDLSKIMDINKIKRETFLLEKVVNACIYENKNGRRYSNMPLKELSDFYDEIEGGLIGFNLIAKDISKMMRGKEWTYGEDSLGRFLESQLLNVVVNATIRNSSNIISQKFKGSLWNQKLKDKEYYNQLCELSGIEDKVKDDFYNYIQD